jgi:hypothetical protein
MGMKEVYCVFWWGDGAVVRLAWRGPFLVLEM